jgi:hypothetical protein
LSSVGFVSGGDAAGDSPDIHRANSATHEVARDYFKRRIAPRDCLNLPDRHNW